MTERSEAESEARRPDSGDGRTHNWLMADLMRGLDARRRTKANGRFVPALEPRRRMEKQAFQAKRMATRVFTIRVSLWGYLCSPRILKDAHDATSRASSFVGNHLAHFPLLFNKPVEDYWTCTRIRAEGRHGSFQSTKDDRKVSSQSRHVTACREVPFSAWSPNPT